MRTLFLVAVLALVAFADSKAKPFLVVHKEVSEAVVVPGADAKFTVTVTNQGENPAFDVQLVDQVPQGEEQTKAVETLAPSESLKLEYTFSPKELGQINVEAAKVTYLEEKDSTSRYTAISNLINEHDREAFDVASNGEFSVVTPTEYERLHTRYVKETIGYLCAALVPIAFPFFMYRTKQGQVDHLLREAKRK